MKPWSKGHEYELEVDMTASGYLCLWERQACHLSCLCPCLMLNRVQPLVQKIQFALQTRRGFLFPRYIADVIAGRWKAVYLQAVCQPRGLPLPVSFFLSKVKNESSLWRKERWVLCQYIYAMILNQKLFPHGRFVRLIYLSCSSLPQPHPWLHHFQELSPADVCQKKSLEEMSISPSFLNFNFYLCSVRERYVHVPVCVHTCGGQSLLSVWCLS